MKIEEGKFYRTRDGRKVGPMKFYAGKALYPWNKVDSDSGRWASDGKDELGFVGEQPSDLIAEWTDEPDTLKLWRDMTPEEKEIADIAAPPKDGAYSRFWVRSDAVTVQFDEDLSLRARQAASRLQLVEAPTVWYEGVTQGEIVGDLRAVLDEDGEQEFVIHPTVGPERIVCRFPDEKRDEMRNFLFKVVTVKGKLHYRKDSPHPVLVEMEGIHDKPRKAETLYELRGLFQGMKRPAQPEQLW